MVTAVIFRPMFHPIKSHHESGLPRCYAGFALLHSLPARVTRHHNGSEDGQSVRRSQTSAIWKQRMTRQNQTCQCALCIAPSRVSFQLVRPAFVSRASTQGGSSLHDTAPGGGSTHVNAAPPPLDRTNIPLLSSVCSAWIGSWLFHSIQTKARLHASLSPFELAPLDRLSPASFVHRAFVPRCRILNRRWLCSLTKMSMMSSLMAARKCNQHLGPMSRRAHAQHIQRF